jgi:hypothetical protein
VRGSLSVSRARSTHSSGSNANIREDSDKGVTD